MRTGRLGLCSELVLRAGLLAGGCTATEAPENTLPPRPRRGPVVMRQVPVRFSRARGGTAAHDINCMTVKGVREAVIRTRL